MKKLLSTIITVAMLLSLTACGENADNGALIGDIIQQNVTSDESNSNSSVSSGKYADIDGYYTLTYSGHEFKYTASIFYDSEFDTFHLTLFPYVNDSNIPTLEGINDADVFLSGDMDYEMYTAYDEAEGDVTCFTTFHMTKSGDGYTLTRDDLFGYPFSAVMTKK